MGLILNKPGSDYNPATSADQAQPDYYDFYTLGLATQGYGVMSGGVVSAGSGLSFSATECQVETPGGYIDAPAVTNVAINAAPGSGTRIDVVSVDPVNGIVYTPGTAEANSGATWASTPVPLFSATPIANALILAVLTIPSGLASLAAGNILDKRWLVRTNVLDQQPLIPTVSQCILANSGVVVPDHYEIGSGLTLEIQAGGILEIT